MSPAPGRARGDGSYRFRAITSVSKCRRPGLEPRGLDPISESALAGLEVPGLKSGTAEHGISPELMTWKPYQASISTSPWGFEQQARM